MTEVEQPPQNGIDLTIAVEDDENGKSRPADIEQDMREMERRKRVEAIMGSKLFREELERIVDSAREGGATAGGILQQLSDIVGLPSARVGNVFRASNCMLPINDIRGVESMGYAKGEKILRCKLAATFRLLDLYGWTQGLGAQITARLKVDQEYFLVNPYGLLYHEVTASSLNKVDMQGHIVEQGTTNFGVNKSHFLLHSVLHAARPDIRVAIYIGCSPVVAVSSLKTGLLPLTKDACVLGEITTHPYTGALLDADERDKLVRNLGPNSKVMLLSNHGALCCGETIEEAFFAACHIVQACETQLKLLPVGLDNLSLIPDESRKTIYDQSRRPPEDLEKKFAAIIAVDAPATTDGSAEVAPTSTKVVGSIPKWRVGGAEFEALMRMLDNAGYRTGYIYRHPLIKSEVPRPKNDVELPPAVSSLGYLLEEEELFRQGIWKKGELRKGGDRSRWLNSPNVYQKVEVLETGTPDPKKITKWVAEGSPTHSTPVRIEDPLQFVPAGTNPKEFKRLQQQIKDNRRADKISAGPQSQILEGVTWDEANRIKDATVSSAGDHVVLMGAASKGIIQRGFQHNATVYKAPYAKNPFDNVTDDELNEYKRTVERKKKSIHGEYTDTDFSESEALSSLQTSGAQQTKHTTTTTAAVSQSEPEDASEHQVMRIETQQAPVPSQPEVVLSDATHKPHNPYNPYNPHNPQQHTTELACFKMFKNQYNQQKQLTLMQQQQEQQQHAHLARKYAFLYEYNFDAVYGASQQQQQQQQQRDFDLFMIHKIEIFPHYTYPLANATLDDAQQQQQQLRVAATYAAEHNNHNYESTPLTPTTPPYRTHSHYGFNYPLTYLPTITLYPANLLHDDVELQRQKVIEFIQSTALSFVAHEQHLNVHDHVDVDDVDADADDGDVVELDCSTSSLYNNTKNSSTNLVENFGLKQRAVADDNGSFISVKEIQLKPKRKLRYSSHTSQNGRTTTTEDENEHEHDDALSVQFSSSLLSLGGGSYPAATTSHHSDHSVLVTTENDHGHEHDDDSCDNSSNYTAPLLTRHAGTENLYRSYVLRNFVPLNQQNRMRAYEHEIKHKPEAEQAMVDLQISLENQQEEQRQQQQQPITLTLNALKRRSSRSRDVIATVSEAATMASNDSQTDTASIRSLEIHINVSIKNSDCAKSLQAHKNEFKTKLERVIDAEISLISQQLATAQENVTDNVNNAQQNCKTTEAHRNHIPTPPPPPPTQPTTSTPLKKTTATSSKPQSPASTSTVCYRHTLSLLEHELENLLNGIIRSNELHNRAILCDCKTKILQISEDIRASLTSERR